jgi:predicted nuclease of predicted toxin-antitoxin system
VKFKLDENLPVELTEDLRSLGHDADTVADEGLRGASDPAVINAAWAADRILGHIWPKSRHRVCARPST